MLMMINGQHGRKLGSSIFTKGSNLIFDSSIAKADMSLVTGQVSDVLDNALKHLDVEWREAHFSERHNDHVYNFAIEIPTDYMATHTKDSMFDVDVSCERTFYKTGFVITTWLSR